MAKLKTFTVPSGFYELAVAAPSMKAALAAWGFAHNAFHQGIAKITQDAAIMAATTAEPGMVLRRPIGGKGVFKLAPDAPKASAPRRGQKPRHKIADPAKIEAAEDALTKAEAAHEARVEAFQNQEAALKERRRAEDTAWDAQRQKLERALSDAKRSK